MYSTEVFAEQIMNTYGHTVMVCGWYVAVASSLWRTEAGGLGCWYGNLQGLPQKTLIWRIQVRDFWVRWEHTWVKHDCVLPLTQKEQQMLHCLAKPLACFSRSGENPSLREPSLPSEKRGNLSIKSNLSTLIVLPLSYPEEHSPLAPMGRPVYLQREYPHPIPFGTSLFCLESSYNHLWRGSFLPKEVSPLAGKCLLPAVFCHLAVGRKPLSTWTTYFLQGNPFPTWKSHLYLQGESCCSRGEVPAYT